jgi:hypothetical protein
MISGVSLRLSYAPTLDRGQANRQFGAPDMWLAVLALGLFLQRFADERDHRSRVRCVPQSRRGEWLHRARQIDGTVIHYCGSGCRNELGLPFLAEQPQSNLQTPSPETLEKAAA